MINVKFPLQSHQKYYITQYEELGFSLLTQMKSEHTAKFSLPHLIRLSVGECTFLNVVVNVLTYRSLVQQAFYITRVNESKGLTRIFNSSFENLLCFCTSEEQQVAEDPHWYKVRRHYYYGRYTHNSRKHALAFLHAFRKGYYHGTSYAKGYKHGKRHGYHHGYHRGAKRM